MSSVIRDPSLLPARYFHLAVMSECDAECKLCATLGCLRPARITSPEFRHQLDLAQRALKTAVVVPPNFLHHPESPQFVSEIAARGLQAIVRLRPEQLLLFSELIATLEYRGATFEVVVSEPLPDRVLGRGRAMAGGGFSFGRAWPAFKTVFVPSRRWDPEMLFESMPFSWRRGAELLAPIPGHQAEALSADELYLFLKRVPALKPYAEMDRIPVGRDPALAMLHPVRFSSQAAHADERTIRLSVIALISKDTRVDDLLASFRTQTLGRDRFEILFAFDRVSDDTVERVAAWSRASGVSASGLELPRRWGQPTVRTAEGWNLVAHHARGTMLLFVTTVSGPDLFSTYMRELDAHRLVVSPKMSSGFVDARPLAFGLTLRHYFDIGGFAEAVQHDGFEFEFVVWKSRRIGVDVFELDAGIGSLAARGAERSKLKRAVNRRHARSAQEFFICTLAPDVFERNYDLMGSGFYWRRCLRAVATMRAVHAIKRVLETAAWGLERQRFKTLMRRKVLA